MYLNNLQTKIFAIILSLFLLFVACATNNSFATNTVQTKSLHPGEQVNFGSKKDFIRIKFEDLKDSRCPINARCVRAGDAIVNLICEDVALKKYNATLKIGESSDFNPDTVEIKINKEIYRIVLESVLPHPEIGKDTVQTATFHFSKM